jgi:C_GCAxxG_C_C family probable redox protein
MDRAAEAYAAMAVGRMNCSQAVLSSFCDEFGLESNLALKLAQGFGGGMGRAGKTCGAVTTAYMVLGLSQVKSSENPRENIEKTYALVQEFNRKFEALHGSVTCKELIGYDLGTPEGLAEARDREVFISVCPEFVSDSVKILETLLKTKLDNV